MKFNKKSGLHWYVAAWHFGTAADPHTASSSHDPSHPLGNAGDRDTDWYVKGLQLGTSTDLGAEEPDWVRLGRSIKGAIARAWASIAKFVSVSDEPRLWKTVSANGETLWNAYDPKTNHYVEGMTEQNMRIWLEERYTR